MSYTDDIPDGSYAEAVAIARRLGMHGHELDLFRPLMNESGLSFKAHNATGDAAGIFQAMPTTLRGLGFVGDWKDFVSLGYEGQLPWMEKYYRPLTGHLVNAVAVYMGTFCPAWIRHASEGAFVICAADGRSDGGLSVHMSQLWYTQNKGLDKNRDGVIDVEDLAMAILSADHGPRWDEFCTKFQAAMIEDVPVFDENNQPVMLLPDMIPHDPYE